MISEEQFRNDKMSFQMCEGIGSLLIKGNKKFSLHIVFATFSFMGTLQVDRKNDVILPEKI